MWPGQALEVELWFLDGFCTPTATKDVRNSWRGACTVGPRHARPWGHSTHVSHCAPLVALGLPQLLFLAPTQLWHRLNLVATSHNWEFSSQAASWWPGDPTGSCPSRVGPQTPSPHPQPLVNVRWIDGALVSPQMPRPWRTGRLTWPR